MRDAMTHRGPDDAGSWFGDGAALGHRRLAVRDPGPAGHQPMLSDDGRFVLAYNGEIYNDAELRRELGGPWRTACDTETLLRWLAAGRPLARVRGMYAFAIIDTFERRLTIARDPIGIKPMFWARLPSRVLFASESHALFEHAELSPEPDPVGVSLYLSSLRTVMGSRTMFTGVHAVRPGESLTFSVDDPSAEPRRARIAIAPAQDSVSDGRVAEVVRDSVRAHLRSDVSLCSLLSGGLDSTIIAHSALADADELRTYCAGAEGEGGDPEVAKSVAAHLVTTHTTALLDEPAFSELWIDSVRASGLPLATPNEVAIRLIARTLRCDGQIVALTGEGADELFAGYEGPLLSAISRGDTSGGRFELVANAWIPLEIKPLLLAPDIAGALGDDGELVSMYEAAFAESDAGDGPAGHLRFQRNVNLPMLLHRLDSATMLESVESRTPLADERVASIAAAIPFDELFDPSGATPATRSKLPLRRAFRDVVPREVLERPKASFPLPFERWMGSAARLVSGSSVAPMLFQPAVVQAMLEDPRKHWHLAWPVINLVLWAERWWGDGLAQASAASTRGTAESSRRV